MAAVAAASGPGGGRHMASGHVTLHSHLHRSGAGGSMSSAAATELRFKALAMLRQAMDSGKLDTTGGGDDECDGHQAASDVMERFIDDLLRLCSRSGLGCCSACVTSAATEIDSSNLDGEQVRRRRTTDLCVLRHRHVSYRDRSAD